MLYNPITPIAGAGLSRVGITYSVDLAHAFDWTGAHTFAAGISAPADLTIGAASNVLLNPTGGYVMPSTAYAVSLGSISKKFLSLHAAELWVETLVAQDTLATIGGRVLIGPTTTLTADLAAGGTSISTKHNNLAVGDRVYLEAAGAIEFMAVTAGPTGTGPYAYTVTRDLDGSGANAWDAGSAIFNTGTTGDGFIDLYSVRGVKSASQYGPAIVGNVRGSATWNDWTEHWALGNLNGVYGYGADTYGLAAGKYAANMPWVSVDATNGFRVMRGITGTQLAQWDASGNILIGQTGAGQANVYISAGALDIRMDTTARIHLAADGSGYLASSAIAWDTSGTLTVGGWTIGASTLTAGSGASAVGLAPGTYPFYAGSETAASAPFRVSAAGALTATSATITGAITASSGSVGGFTINASTLTAGSGASAVGLAPGTYPFYAGSETAASAPFRVSAAGILTATGAVLSGSLSAASDTILVNANGVTVLIPEDAFNPVKAVRLAVDGTTPVARLEGYWVGGTDAASYARLEVDYGSYANLYLTADATFEGNVIARAESGASYSAQITAHSLATPLVINQVGISICDAVVGIFDADGLAITGHMVIDHGADDDNIMELRSSDVAHGMTTLSATSAYARALKASATAGGLTLSGLSEGTQGLVLQGIYTTDSTTKSTVGVAPITFSAYKANGTGVQAQGSDANLACFMSYSTTVWIIDEDGDTWQGGGISCTNIAAAYLGLNQGAGDGVILAFSSSDVAHGITDWAATDCYGYFVKVAADTGGLIMRGFSEGVTGIYIDGVATTEDTTKSTSGAAPITLRVLTKNGTSVAAPGANANAVRIFSGSTKWLCDTEGDTWQNGDCSALSFTDRTPIAKSIEEALAIVRSHRAISGKAGELDHAQLHPSARSNDGRNLSMTVSAAAQAISAALDQIEALGVDLKGQRAEIADLQDRLAALGA